MREFKMKMKQQLKSAKLIDLLIYGAATATRQKSLRAALFGLAMMTTICRLWQILRS